MAEHLRGSCACGAITYRLEPPTEFVSHCHCASCRRAHAAAFVTWTAVPVERIAWQGEAALTWFASSPGVERSFCGRCGTPLFFRGEPSPDKVYVPVATLLDPLDRQPESHVSFEERVAWVDGLSALPCFREKGDAPERNSL